jgi:hypothetical protein
VSDQLDLVPSDNLTQVFEQLDPEVRDRWLQIQIERKRERELAELREQNAALHRRVEFIETTVTETAKIKNDHVKAHSRYMSRTEFAAALPGGPAWTRATMLLQVVGIFTKSRYKPWTRGREPVRPKSDPVVRNHVVVRNYDNAEFESQVWEIDPDWALERINAWLADNNLLYGYRNAARSQKSMHDFIDRLWEEYGRRRATA